MKNYPNYLYKGNLFYQKWIELPNCIVYQSVSEYPKNDTYDNLLKEGFKNLNVMYKLVDTLGYIIRTFPTYALAHAYRAAMGRLDWKIL